MLEQTVATMEALHAEGRDHIWSYYTRNMVRPTMLSELKVDAIVGNPPWLTYNKTQAIVRSELERQSKSSYRIWTGGRYATHQDVAGLFFTRCVDLYLDVGGSIGMVMPQSALQTGQYREWRTGAWNRVAADLALRFPWDLERIEPNTFFPVPSCVIFAERLEEQAGEGRRKPRGLPASASQWLGPEGGPYRRGKRRPPRHLRRLRLALRRTRPPRRDHRPTLPLLRRRGRIRCRHRRGRRAGPRPPRRARQRTVAQPGSRQD